MALAFALFLRALPTLADHSYGEACTTGTADEACTVSNGVGVQSCIQTGDDPNTGTWSPCKIQACLAGFHWADASNPTVCIPDSTATLPMDTQVSTDSATATQTEASIASAVATEAGTKHQADTRKAAESNDGTQKQSLELSHSLLGQGADLAATLGVIYCAEAANKLKSNPKMSASDLAACRDQFGAASEMNGLAKRDGYQPDPGVLGSDGAKSILGELEKKFGLGSDDFVSKMLAGKGSRDTFSDLLDSKLGAAKLAEAYAAADAIPPAAGAEKFVVSFGGGDKARNAPKGALREALRSKLKDAGRDVASATVPYNPASPFKDEKAIALGDQTAEQFFPGLGGKGDGLTLFQIVHVKYDELARRQNLLWTR